MNIKMPSKQEALYRTMHNSHKGYRYFNHGIYRMKWWAENVPPIPASILEVGCGNGILCQCLSIMQYDITGLDIVEGSYDRRDYSFVKHDMQKGAIPFKDDLFDFCVSFDFLEHLPEKWCANAICEMIRVTKKGKLAGSVSCVVKEILHETVRPSEWWIEIFDRLCRCEMEYHIDEGKETNGMTLLYRSKKEGF